MIQAQVHSVQLLLLLTVAGQGIRTLIQQILGLVQVVVMLVAQVMNTKQEPFVTQLDSVMVLGVVTLTNTQQTQELVVDVVMSVHLVMNTNQVHFVQQ